jgi:prepilin-type processing-associated H-X9-DG protein
MDRARPVVVYAPPGTPDVKRDYHPSLQCPEADQGRPHAVSYAMNMVAAVSPYDEARVGEPPNIRALTHTTKLSQLLKETAVVWDASEPHGFEWQPVLRLGYDIDNQRFWQGSYIPQQRYYTLKDPYANVPPLIYGHNKPVLMNVTPFKWYHRDPRPAEVHPYQGNLRFRHRKETTCNAGFADGSVRAFTGRFNPDKTMLRHDALRRYFMIKWPTGVSVNPQYPF